MQRTTDDSTCCFHARLLKLLCFRSNQEASSGFAQQHDISLPSPLLLRILRHVWLQPWPSVLQHLYESKQPCFSFSLRILPFVSPIFPVSSLFCHSRIRNAKRTIYYKHKESNLFSLLILKSVILRLLQGHYKWGGEIQSLGTLRILIGSTRED